MNQSLLARILFASLASLLALPALAQETLDQTGARLKGQLESMILTVVGVLILVVILATGIRLAIAYQKEHPIMPVIYQGAGVAIALAVLAAFLKGLFVAMGGTL